MSLRKGDKIYMWWSASHRHQVTFVKWVLMRMGNGGEDTNKVGVGCLVYSDWLFRMPLLNRSQRHGLREGYYRVNPYHNVYRKDPYYNRQPKGVRRPTVEDMRRKQAKRKERG